MPRKEARSMSSRLRVRSHARPRRVVMREMWRGRPSPRLKVGWLRYQICMSENCVSDMARMDQWTSARFVRPQRRRVRRRVIATATMRT